MNEKKSGFEPIPYVNQPCRDRDHHPPTLIYIPPGQQFRHVCPSCVMETVLRPPQVHFLK